jgi:hypothetical protein
MPSFNNPLMPMKTLGYFLILLTGKYNPILAPEKHH